MATRALITLKGQFDTLHFYNHNDGSPDNILPYLHEFLDKIKTFNRPCASQMAGWLIEIGRTPHLYDWKYSRFEPIMGPIDGPEWLSQFDYTYKINLLTTTITINGEK